MEQKQQIIQAIAKRAHEVTHPGSTVLLFGSQARGDARPDSDWDVLILLNKERISPEDRDKVSYPLRELGWQINAVVNPIMFTSKEWESKSFTPFYKNVMKEGVVL